MAQIAATAVQAAPLYLQCFAIIAFECITCCKLLAGGKLRVGLCAHKYAYAHGAIPSSYVGESDICRGQSL